MRALILSEDYKLSIKEVPTPNISANEVLIKVKAVGICGSDLHGFDGSTGRRIPPIIMGHELSGTIEKVGESSSFEIGDNVTAHSTIYCRNCKECKQGRFSICEKRTVIGVSCDEFKRDGAMADYISLPSHILYKIPSNVSFEEAALAEPCAVALHAINDINISKEETILVFGTGTIGILIIQCLKIKGYKNIIAIDKIHERLLVAKKSGANRCINWFEIEKGNFDLKNIKCIVDAVGKSETINTAINLINNGGLIKLVGNFEKIIDLPLQDVVSKELKIIGSYAFHNEISKCLELMANDELDLKTLISDIIQLEHATEYFERTSKNHLEKIKTIIKL